MGDVVKRSLFVWIPSNREYDDHTPRAMDGLNEIINQNRKSRFEGAQRERENVEWCAWHIKKAMREQHWPPMNSRDRARRVNIVVTFVEVNQRRDVPNIIGGGLKYVCDALTRPIGRKRIGASAIYDDSPKWLGDIGTNILIDHENPGIHIAVWEE